MPAVELWDTSLWDDANLQAYYRLDDANDNKPLGSINLTNNNSVGFAAGQFGNAADFGSSNTNKNLTVTNGFSISGNVFTVFGWVKLYSFPSSGNVDDFLTLFTGGGRFYARHYNDGAQQTANFIRNDGVSQESVGYNAFTPGSGWNFWALCHNGTTMEYYINASSRGTVNPSTTDRGLTSQLYLGSNDNGQYSNSLVDEVAIFNRRLTATEISNYYNGALGASSAHTAVKNKDALAKASVKNINGLAIASVKNIDGLV